MSDVSYTEVATHTVKAGYEDQDRTGTGTVSAPFQMSKYDLVGLRIPLLSTKKVNARAILIELEWYLSGQSNIKFLQENGVHIWDAWADENGELGPVYGCQWRNWEDTRVVSCSDVSDFEKRGFQVIGALADGNSMVVQRKIDQLQNIVDTLRTNPQARRILLNAWNVAQIEDMKLPPCHMLWQLCSKPLPTEQRAAIAYEIGLTERKYDRQTSISACYSDFAEYVDDALGGCYEKATDEVMDGFLIPKRGLFSGLYQRSVDVMVGMPFNIGGYAILSHFIAQCTDHMAVELTHFGGDVHVYSDHMDGYKEQMSRDPIPSSDPVVLFPEHYTDIEDFSWEEVCIEGYEHHPFIRFPVAV